MKLGIDATAISGTVVGHYSYVANLIHEMFANDMMTDFEPIIYCRGQIPVIFSHLSDNVKFKVCKFNNRKICEQLWLSSVAPFDSLDVFHSTWSMPVFHPKRCILTLHGLASYLFPSNFTKSYKLYWNLTAKRNYKKAARYIAISQSTKQDFIEYMDIPEDKIDVVHHGVDTNFFSKIDDDNQLNRLKKSYSLPNRFILFVSAIIPIKNLVTLIKSYDDLINHKEFSDIGLVIAGSRGWNCEPVFETVNQLKLEDKVIFTGYFPQEDLPALYSSAELFVLPSYYEGFGIPVLEAFACGTPVITSNTSCLPEIAGNAAMLMDPYNQDDLTEAMKKVLSDKILQKTMIEKGLERVKKFSWRKTAEKTIKVYEKAMRY